MTRVFSAHAVSVDGFITGRAPGRRLGDAGLLFDWHFDGDTGSEVFDGFRLSAESARVFDAEASRVGAVVAGRNTYDDSGWAEGGTPHPHAPLVVLSHRPPPAVHDRQTFATDVTEAVAREIAGNRDVALMGGGLLTAALNAGLVDELVLHQVPVLLGAGRGFFRELPAHVALRAVEVVAAPNVTHLRYEVIR